MTLNDADIGMEYKVRNINAEDEEMVSFLFSLGCYSGEPITVVSKKRSGVVVSIKDGRYNMDKELSSAIEIA
ncbi:MAG: ferrous iron transport protein A [Acetatifactor sp.]|nr:ferrous iron transport protein A [Acetatifactor sp.]